MNNCPCCSNTMLRHIRQNRVAWFCRSCWQEMPLLDKKHSSLGLDLDKSGPLPERRRLITV